MKQECEQGRGHKDLNITTQHCHVGERGGGGGKSMVVDQARGLHTHVNMSACCCKPVWTCDVPQAWV